VATGSKSRGSARGAGQYEWGARYSRDRARDLFLHAVQQCEPRVLKDLQNGPFRLFRKLPKTLEVPKADASTEELEHWARQFHLLPEFELQHDPFAKSLMQWLKDSHLPHPPVDDDWCWRRAVLTLGMWRKFPHLVGRWAPRIGRSFLGRALADRPFSFSLEPMALGVDLTRLELKEPTVGHFVFPSPDLEMERAAGARQRILKAFAEALNRHMQELRGRFESSLGWASTRQKRKLQHFEWLARYQVQHWSYERIRREYNVRERKTVEDAVKRTAELVGLPLRPAKGGRPPGVKELRSRRRALK
jgi:hypothetical protein